MKAQGEVGINEHGNNINLKSLPKIKKCPKSPINGLDVVDYIYDKVSDVNIGRFAARSVSPGNIIKKDLTLRGFLTKQENTSDLKPASKSYKINESIQIFNKKSNLMNKSYLLPSINKESSIEQLCTERIMRFLSPNNTRSQHLKGILTRKDYMSPEKLVKRRERKFKRFKEAYDNYQQDNKIQNLSRSILQQEKAVKKCSERMKWTANKLKEMDECEGRVLKGFFKYFLDLKTQEDLDAVKIAEEIRRSPRDLERIFKDFRRMMLKYKERMIL
ncbi:unnamed protein product [Blepharisma stoltei]|uniref:Uncharacterized protein n=1 Tax=Blepharisma stoltei TaxID=1481888 RepID=A0AAU9IGH3_9CILI|nr:unnamed protein product [Blepharisma stoltei]